MWGLYRQSLLFMSKFIFLYTWSSIIFSSKGFCPFHEISSNNILFGWNLFDLL
jgi:hypothetical protein